MDILNTYLPMDRRHALAHGFELPDRTIGTALFADISGFTPLTNMLVTELGPLRGSEELTRYINQVFDALTVELERYGGSVIGFSGDAITCWFDQDDGSKGVASALAMQAAMNQFEHIRISEEASVSLAMKAAVAHGPARRFLVGDPQIHVIEVLAGRTLDRLAAAEQQAGRGEVILDRKTADGLQKQIQIKDWRRGESRYGNFALVEALNDSVKPAPWPDLSDDSLNPNLVRPWLLPAVYRRIIEGKGEFLAEFRPAATVFVQFGGIDYDNDDSAGEILDSYIREAQSILGTYGSNILQITVGDKGSYFQAAFGTPVAYEDFAKRAASAALRLRQLKPGDVHTNKLHIGIGMGRMRVGAYGGSHNRTYGVQGNEVNLSARLMQAAGPDQIMVSAPLYKAAGEEFVWKELSPIIVKGRQDPIAVYSLQGRKEPRTLNLKEPKYILPMVGRVQERQKVKDLVGKVMESRGKLLGLRGEAGIGKSRMIADILHETSPLGFQAFGGECQSYGTNTSYLVWERIWWGLFGLDPNWTDTQITASLNTQLEAIDPKLVPRMPLLGPVLNIKFPENDLTRSLDAQLRKSSREALLLDVLRSKVRDKPTIIVLDNLHWIDPLSYDLLLEVGRAAPRLPVLLLCAYRSLEDSNLALSGLEKLPSFTEIHLKDFSIEESHEWITLKYKQLYRSETEIPDELVEIISVRAQGNPFYIEELLNYLWDRDIPLDDLKALKESDLPTSLHSLILNRIDQRTETQKITLKVASVVGRIFVAAWLWGTYPELGNPENIKHDLEVLKDVDLTPLESEEPELTYLFKHIVTQEVTYDSLPYATRALLHNQLAQFLEKQLASKLDNYIDLLAFHYERSENTAKKIEYMRKAGDAAQEKYANEAAIRYFERLMPLLPEEERVEVMIKLGQVLELAGRWEESREIYLDALEISESNNDRHSLAKGKSAMGELCRKRGFYDESETLLEDARSEFTRLGDQGGLGDVLHSEGTLAASHGDLDKARQLYLESMVIRQSLGKMREMASLKNNLGIIERLDGNLSQARLLQLEGLEIRRELNDRFGIAASLNNLGNISLELEEYTEAKEYLEESVAIQKEIGSKFYIANALNNLGNVTRDQGEYEQARGYYLESLEIMKELGDGRAIAYLLEDIGGLEAKTGNYAVSLQLVGAAAALRNTLGAQLTEHELEKLEEQIQDSRENLGGELQQLYLEQGAAIDIEAAIQLARQGRFQLEGQ